MVVLNYLLDDLQTSQCIILLFFPSESIEDLHKIIVVLLQVEDAEVALGYLLQDSICLFFDDLVFFLLEAVASHIEYQFPAALEMQGVVTHEVTKTADH